MARSTYISENITPSQRDMLLLLNENEIDIFSLDDLKELVSDSLEDSNEVIENLVHKKIFLAVARLQPSDSYGKGILPLKCLEAKMINVTRQEPSNCGKLLIHEQFCINNLFFSKNMLLFYKLIV